MMENDYLKEIFKPRNQQSNKSNFGNSTIIGGCVNYVGAPKFAYESCAKILCSLGESSMLVGSGTSTIALPSNLLNYIYPFLNYSSVYKLSSDGEKIIFKENEIQHLIKKSSSFAIGMGSGNSETDKIVEYILKNGNQNLVIDADALYKCKDYVFNNRAILTPHLGEFSKMIGSFDPIRLPFLAKDYARNHKCVLVVKDYKTIITDGNSIYENNNGNAKLSKGGSGDCLAGIICGLLAFGTDLLNAARAGCYILGRCAEISKVNEYSHLPKDIIAVIPNVIDEIIESRNI